MKPNLKLKYFKSNYEILQIIQLKNVTVNFIKYLYLLIK